MVTLSCLNRFSIGLVSGECALHELSLLLLWLLLNCPRNMFWIIVMGIPIYHLSSMSWLKEGGSHPGFYSAFALQCGEVIQYP